MNPSLLDRRSFLRAVGAGSLAVLAGCSQACAPFGAGLSRADEAGLIEGTVFVYDTVVTLRAACARATLDAALERLEYFESILSRTVPSSDIGRVNEAGGMSVPVAEETADLISKALRYCETSGGAFDITIGAASSLWDFGQGIVPNDEALAEAVTHIDYRNVRLEGTTVTLLDPQAKLDLGGIAKGYIADDLARMLRRDGCGSASLDLGGDVRFMGTRPDGSPWRAGVGDPSGPGVVATAECDDGALVTSGLTERCFSDGAKTYWHILDPKTGRPVETDIASATVRTGSALEGDGLTKPLFFMGMQRALEHLEQCEGAEGLLVSADGKAVQTSCARFRL